MVTPANYTKDGNYYGAVTLFGLSSDTKPDATNGSVFIEMDTSTIYFYDEESGDWLEWGAADGV